MNERLTKMPTKSLDELVLDREQVEARDHVMAGLKLDGSHDTNHCPRHTRALCSYKRTIEAMRPEDFA